MSKHLKKEVDCGYREFIPSARYLNFKAKAHMQQSFCWAKRKVEYEYDMHSDPQNLTCTNLRSPRVPLQSPLIVLEKPGEKRNCLNPQKPWFRANNEGSNHVDENLPRQELKARF